MLLPSKYIIIIIFIFYNFLYLFIFVYIFLNFFIFFYIFLYFFIFFYIFLYFFIFFYIFLYFFIFFYIVLYLYIFFYIYIFFYPDHRRLHCDILHLHQQCEKQPAVSGQLTADRTLAHLHQQIGHFAGDLVEQQLDDAQDLGARPDERGARQRPARAAVVRRRRLGARREGVVARHLARERRHERGWTRRRDQRQRVTRRATRVGRRAQRQAKGHAAEGQGHRRTAGEVARPAAVVCDFNVAILYSQRR